MVLLFERRVTWVGHSSSSGSMSEEFELESESGFRDGAEGESEGGGAVVPFGFGSRACRLAAGRSLCIVERGRGKK